MQPNNGIDLDDLFGTKPPAPPAPTDDLPPPYDGPVSGGPSFSPPQPAAPQQTQSYQPHQYAGGQWQNSSPLPPPPQQQQQQQQQQSYQQQPPYHQQQQQQSPQQQQQPTSFQMNGQGYSQPYGTASPPQSQQPQPYGVVQGYGSGGTPHTNADAYPAPYTCPYPSSNAAPAPAPAPAAQADKLPSSPNPTPVSAEDDDRAQLEKIIRLRRELEQEQARDREKREALQSWGCPQCTYRNPLDKSACVMCGVARAGYASTSTNQASPPAAQAPKAPQAPPQAPRPAGLTAWQCGICLAPNEAEDARCRVCQAYQANGTPITNPNPSAGPAAGPASSPSIASDWMCSVCGKVNPPTAANCSVCHGYQRNGTPVASKGAPAHANGGGGGGGGGQAQPARPTIWNCPVCTFENPLATAVCSACRTGKRPPEFDPAAIAKSSGGAGEKAKKMWPCPTCTFMNKMRRSKCDMCGSARPAQYAPEKSAADKAEKKREEQSDDDEVQWQDDNVAKACNSCRQEFGLLRRRHHCRKCGYVFCATCSPYYLVNKKTLMPERVCVNCFNASNEKK